MKAYVLQAYTETENTRFSDGFYTGDTYQYQGEIYAVVERELDLAKMYFSEKRAQSAANSLNRKVCNYKFTVFKIEGDR